MVEFKDISFITRGKRRKEVFFSLEDKPKTITTIKKELKKSISNISFCIKELEKKNYIVSKNPEDYHYKYYEITEFGKKVLEEIEKLEE